MTEKDKEIQEMRRELEHLRGSETVLFYLQTDARGFFIHDVAALDRGIKNLHRRCREAEKAAQLAQAEAILYRRKYEALELERKEEEENRFPLFDFDHRADENKYAQAPV